MRINRYIASSGICSRRKAESFVREGRVTINGTVAELHDTVKEGDTVKIDGEKIGPPSSNTTIAYNKPKGIECTTDQNIRGNIISEINYPTRLFTIGRLDKDSEGLILLTNDGDLCYKLTKASELHQKEYEVTVNKPIGAGFVAKMSKGVEILNTITAPCVVKKTSPTTFNIVLIQGLNRQIRRMCEALGYRVIKLKRIRIDKLTLSGLEVGKYKKLSQSDINKTLLSKPKL